MLVIQMRHGKVDMHLADSQFVDDYGRISSLVDKMLLAVFI